MFVEQLDPHPTGQRLLSYLPALLPLRTVSQEQVPGDNRQLCPYSLRSYEARGCLSYYSSAFFGSGVPRAQGAGSGRVLSYLPVESS